MDSAWFDEDIDFPALRRSSVVRARSHWSSSSSNHVSQGSVASSVSHLSFLEHSLDHDLQHRLRDSSRLGHATSRRLGLAERFDSLMRNTSDSGRFQLRDEEELSKNFEAIKEENLKLQAVITDVTEVNKRWQKYNNDRQMYVQRLLTTIQDQQEQMNKTVESRLLLSKERSNLEDGDILSEKSRLLEEVREQRGRLESLEREYREHVAVLEFQVKAHRDDWEAERSEKQQVLKDKMAAEAKVRLLQKDVRCLKLKLREERLENANLCSCCNMHETDTTACPTPDKNTAACPTHSSKTYRSSVHLPCTSSHLLPRGTTMHFGDDVTIDSDLPASNLDKSCPLEGAVRSTPTSDDESEVVPQNNLNQPLKPTDSIVKRATDSKEESNPLKSSLKRTNFQQKPSRGKTDKSDVCLSDATGSEAKEKVYQSVSQPNLTVHPPKLSSSVLLITPSQNSSAGSLQVDPADAAAAADGASGVCIGFNNGLASVLTFPQSPIVKSFSLPASRGADSVSVKSFVPLTQPSSLDSSWCALPIASPPSYATSAESVSDERKSGGKLSVLGAYAKSIKLSKEYSDQSREDQSELASCEKVKGWKTKYSEEGVATQTKEDLICPGCGQIFPPILHVRFLDHFEKCQSKGNYSSKKTINQLGEV